jgi:hypothetical protein
MHAFQLASLPLDDESVNYESTKSGGTACAARLIRKAGEFQIVVL